MVFESTCFYAAALLCWLCRVATKREMRKEIKLSNILLMLQDTKTVMTTINLSVEIFTSMCYPECLRQSRMSQVGCDPKKFGKVSDDNAWLKI